MSSNHWTNVIALVMTYFNLLNLSYCLGFVKNKLTSSLAFDPGPRGRYS